jgi:hypothetical protein
MGGQACVLYGGAEFSRDLDLVVLADSDNLERLAVALKDLGAVPIAVPPFDFKFLERGHALHFRCERQDVLGLRIDIMSNLRGLGSFDELWSRRQIFFLEGDPVDLLGYEDLVAAKKTQMPKDWLMIQRLIEQVYFTSAASAEFLFRELRTPELLIDLAAHQPELARQIAAQRPAVQSAVAGDHKAVVSALRDEEDAIREQDRAY